MKATKLCTVFLVAGVVAIRWACVSAFGQGSEGARSAPSLTVGNAETAPSAQGIVALLEAGDADNLGVVIAKYPRLAHGILTTDGVTILAYAAMTGNPGTVRVLISAGAPLDARDKLGRTPLYLAVINNRENTARQLAAAGANVDLPDKDGVAPLHLAAKSGSLAMVSDLLAHGAAVDIRSGRETTPLAIAAYFGNLRLVQFLLEKSANVNSADVDGVTVLHNAAQSKNPEVVRYLLAKGARRDALDSGQHTPAYWAKKYGDMESFRLLSAESASAPETGKEIVREHVEVGYFTVAIPAGWAPAGDSGLGLSQDEKKVYGLNLLGPTVGNFGVRIGVHYYAPGNLLHKSHERFIEFHAQPALGVNLDGKIYGPVERGLVGKRPALVFDRTVFEYYPPRALHPEKLPVYERFAVVPAEEGFYVLRYFSPQSVAQVYVKIFEATLASFLPVVPAPAAPGSK